ncbi:hypothetical protein [Sporolactobacillus pectinivorans]|uniref:hypothetical protein n=1 Tax=Sporolactobacillus pectinivorans TaxID=1591408 RepID=UPI000C259F9E|nr:hypothetical protein [Sporolactobacillus pectinivorans]
MIRSMYVIKYVDQSTVWYLSKTVQINTEKRKYERGDVIQVDDQKYVVVEDYGYLRVKHFIGEINPLKPLISQIPNK